MKEFYELSQEAKLVALDSLRNRFSGHYDLAGLKVMCGYIIEQATGVYRRPEIVMKDGRPVIDLDSIPKSTTSQTIQACERAISAQVKHQQSEEWLLERLMGHTVMFTDEGKIA